MTNLLRIIAAALFLVPACAVQAHPGAHVVIDYFTTQIREHPAEQALYIQRGIAYSNDGQFDPALADFRKAEQLGDPAVVAFELGVLHYRKGDFPGARSYLDAFLAKHPGHPGALEYRARLRRDAGDPLGAVADYRAYFASVPRPNPGDYSAAAALLAGVPEQGAAAALALLDEGMARLGLLPQLQRQAIALELARGRVDLAISRQRALEPVLRGSPDWGVEMGELLLRAGRSADARGHFEQAARELAAARPTPARLEMARRAQAGLAATTAAPGGTPAAAVH